MTNPRVTALYRRQLKTLMTVFKGDYEMFHRSRMAIRGEILKYKDETDQVKINKLLFGFEEGRRALLSGIMQVDSQLLLFRLMCRRTDHTDGRLERNTQWGLRSNQWTSNNHLIEDRECSVMRGK